MEGEFRVFTRQVVPLFRIVHHVVEFDRGVLVLVQPLAHGFPRTEAQGLLAAVTAKLPIQRALDAEHLAAQAFIGTAPLAIGRTALALSPDGATLAYVAERGTGTQLYLRPMDRDTVFPLAGTEDACCPFFSPDGAWLAFHAHDQLNKVRIGFAGPPIPILTVNSFFAADWGDDGWIVVSDLQGRHTVRVNAETGAKEDLHLTMNRPKVLPGGHGIISDTSLFLPATNERRRLLTAGTDARYAPSGHITYAHQGELWAVPFDLSKLRVTGEPLAVLPHLRTESTIGHAQYSFAANGLLVYAPGGANDLSRLVVRSRSGTVDKNSIVP